MRQQLIEWLSDEIAPEIRRNKNAHSTILKFARDRNLTPTQVESLGQLFNTAKTLNYLEKSANRGDDFPILDVEKLVDEYMTTDAAPKKASSSVQWNTLGVPSEVSDLRSDARLPDAFAGVTIPMQHAESLEEIPCHLTKAARAAIDNHAHRSWVMAEADVYEQIKFDAVEDTRKLAKEIELTFREHPDLDFETVESQVLGLHGEEYRPTLDKVAGFLTARHVAVKRASAALQNGLVQDKYSVVSRIEKLHEQAFLINEADAQIKAAFSQIGLAAKSNVPPPAVPSGPAPSQDFSADRPAPPPRTEGRGKDSPVGKSKSPSTPDQSKGKDTYLGQANSAFDKLIEGPLGEFKKRLQSATAGTNNTDQRQVDTSFQDVQQMATLQNLMMNDEVLSEADPEHVLAMFNTIRRTAPSLAGDINVLRVALRTAVQHDGISPFDVKSLSDTELSNQKTDLGRRQLDAHLYKGAPLPAQTMPKG